ncbi:MAG: hypothetical protein ACREQ9_09865, partial [Candidatus Binatia bacterium]
MKLRTVFLIGLFIIAPAALRAAEDAAAKLDLHRIVEVTGGKGQLDEKEGAFKVSMPRTDLSVCVYDDLSAKDVAVSVKLRPVSGEVDQAGGIVWRYRDRGNYYVARANALEDNVVLYKVENGKRTDLKPVGVRPLAYGKKVEVPAGEWSELRVVAKGSKHSVDFNGEHLFDVEDETFSAPGRVGLWTKADSVT